MKRLSPDASVRVGDGCFQFFAVHAREDQANENAAARYFCFSCKNILLAVLVFDGESVVAQRPGPTSTRPASNQKPTPTPTKGQGVNSRLASSCANIVPNVEFEIPVISGKISVYAPDTCGNWTVESGSIDLCGAGYWQHVSGNQSVDLNAWSVGTIYQDISTISGQHIC